MCIRDSSPDPRRHPAAAPPNLRNPLGRPPGPRWCSPSILRPVPGPPQRDLVPRLHLLEACNLNLA
eukprot:3709398-Prorocentrum_lima.AAC.1